MKFTEVNPFNSKIQKKSKVHVSLSMRYGNPSIKSGLQDLKNKGVKEVLVIPLYPQFAMSSVETITVETEDIKNKFFPKMNLFHLLFLQMYKQSSNKTQIN